MLKHLNNVTLVAVATTEVEATAKALEYSTKKMSFEKVLLFSHYNPLADNTIYEHIKIEPFQSVGEWGKFVVFDLYKFITTEYIILVHADGFIVNPEQWDDVFLQYDYIGAPWPLPKDSFSYRDYFGNIIRVGNSVSLRSLNILKLPDQLGLDWKSADHGFFHEDGFLCVQNRHIFQQQGIKYPPLEVACRFSREKPIAENRGIVPFAFHKWEGENRSYPRFSSKSSIRHTVKKVIRKIRSVLA
ncbi:DUF5672 family protein [Sulfuricurvum sp. RIFCSPLOWO2_12_FULL_43_24]|uniref:DUF5672 family protein n=1 Tax=Sulfuricurvum sp. RIFCSPLOWO2_12_FULL_43_24 TaxID=1802247 RepID=UPI0008C3B2E6|nr:DUF5672 family protein [Sulfuricurvum sp. RIFCSPLOWO2_12_FULL_43_24]OHD90691.1 MAG: hypothetical protein A3G19_04080 [Sulfuricurvum sp. RIFCSPLOWO2_12_FULL_43_24]